MIRELSNRNHNMKWHKRWTKIVKVQAGFSNCLSRQVGAIIVRDKRIVSTGYNGVPSDFTHCKNCYNKERISGHDLHQLPCVHAEQNALLQCAMYGTPCYGADMYVSIMPCNDCLKQIIQAGIKHLYCLEPYFLAGKDEKLRQYLLEEAYRVKEFEMILLPQVGMN